MKQLTISQIRSRIKNAGIDMGAIHYLKRTWVDVGFEPDNFSNSDANKVLAVRVANALGWDAVVGHVMGTSLYRVLGPTRPTLAYID